MPRRPRRQGTTIPNTRGTTAAPPPSQPLGTELKGRVQLFRKSSLRSSFYHDRAPAGKALRPPPNLQEREGQAFRQANGAAATARPERKTRPLGRPVAYLPAEMEPGLKQMLTVVEMKQSIAPFRHSRSSQRRKACALRKLACLAETSQLQMELEAEASPELQHLGMPPFCKGCPTRQNRANTGGCPMKTWGRGAGDIPSASFMDTVRPL